MKKKLLVLVVLASVTIASEANSHSEKQGTFRIKSKAELSKAERDYHWQNTRKDEGGFTRVSTNEEYVHLVRTFEEHPRAKDIESPQIGPFKAFKQVNEDDLRQTSIYVDASGQKMMLTAWDFAASGAELTVPDEFVNARIGSWPAAIALAYAPETDSVLWKVTYWTTRQSCEVYVEDFISRNGTPGRTVASVIAHAKKTLPICESFLK